MEKIRAIHEVPMPQGSLALRNLCKSHWPVNVI